MSQKNAKAIAWNVLPSGCKLLIIGVILIVFGVGLLLSGEWVGFFICVAIGMFFMLILPLVFRAGFSRPHRSVVVYIGGPVPWGGSLGWLVMWGLTMIFLVIYLIPPIVPYFLGSVNFLDLALQSSISSLLSFPGTWDFTSLAPWFPLVLSLGGAFVAGIYARKPMTGGAAAAMMYFFTGIFLFFFTVLFLAFSIDLNLVGAFIVSQLTVRWAGGIGLLVSVLPPLLLGALGGLVNKKKD